MKELIKKTLKDQEILVGKSWKESLVKNRVKKNIESKKRSHEILIVKKIEKRSGLKLSEKSIESKKEVMKFWLGKVGKKVWLKIESEKKMYWK